MFSIIIPLYNKEKFIQNTLEKVLEQSFQDFEVIIVDDGSTDGGAEIVNNIQDERIKYFWQENQGVSSARNKGISLAKNEYICFLDADDEWKPNFLEKMHSLLIKYPEYKVFSAAIEIDMGKKTIPALYTLSNPVAENIYIEDYFKGSMKYPIISISSSVFHRSVFQNVGAFDEDMRSGEDTDLWIRIGKSYDVIFLDEILCRYVFDNQGLSKNVKYKGIKIKYEKFRGWESENQDIKKYLDWNRYSELLSNKILGHNANIKLLKYQIDFQNLSIKQRFLASIPNIFLRFLLKIEPVFIKLGFKKTAFKG